MTNLNSSRSRIQSIDVLRGTVMVIMALDHVRDFFYKADLQNAAAAATDPTNMATTNPGLFFTRWITHFCAPVFVFLSGTSAWLMGRKKSKAELSAFLIKRGFWLVLVELIIITLAWTFDPLYHVFIFQVIWALGISMIILGVVIYLPYNLLLFLGLVIVFGHNLLSDPQLVARFKGGLFWDLLYYGPFSVHPIDPNRIIIVVYPFLPWSGLMMLGYCFGKLYSPGYEAARRKKVLITLGLSLVVLFIVLRAGNFYGDPDPWSSQPRGPVYTFLSFLNTTKYPPSLLFLSMTIGPAMILLAYLERWQNRFTNIMNVYGRVPMMYYILHMYLIHIIVVIVFFASGYTAKDIIPKNTPFLFRPADFGFNLVGVYLVWLFVVIVLYPLCKRYNEYKSTHRKWWLSYL